ncbi:uncharacterized protein LOC123920706 isoform X2 [Trifolium pratense]|uniref:uncharacterized protein LOC123920706 isoform X2 n=2 Tax=Trifolium pratense TaxID=57577 RepID=UPI001E693055|nr:uncharacterized protein LOC123920706 isoform X2 [Trifolium pratense]
MACSYDGPSLEHIPLSQRRKFAHSDSTDSHSQNHSRIPFSSTPPLHATVKNEHDDSNSQVTYSKVRNDAIGVEKSSVNTSSLRPSSTVCDVPVTMKVEDSEILLSNVDNGGNGNTSFQLDFPATKVKEEIHESIVDELDHVVLIERQRMLLARRLAGLPSPAFEANSEGLTKKILEQNVEKVNGEFFSVDGKITVARDQCYDTPEGSNTSLSELPHEATLGSSLSTEHASSKSRRPVVSACPQEHNQIVKSEEMIMHFDSHEEQGVMPIDNNEPSSSGCPTSVKIKDEPWDNSEIHDVNEDAMGNISIKQEVQNDFINEDAMGYISIKQEVHNDFNDDQVEHMSLADRLNFLTSRENSSLNIPMSCSYLKKTKPSSSVPSFNFSESAEPSHIKRARKRKKTATNSVQTALEEDAPGLLEVLVDKGVLVDDIKLYGETVNDEALDESFCEDSFSELEAVMTKIFSQRQSFIKFPVIRAGKGSRVSYCLACLISLVEQTRYLKLQKWPVEWGWCRDIQSFIFVFPRHNRIVLERPEYGYATYFFELVASLPVEWQIKRLVVAMKLTTCSRISIIENKELSVGEDLAEGEAKVLMEYGWTPNTGLGTMLNYRDRVVHDRKNTDTSEWRTKIGKLLIDGYVGGTILMSNIPKSVANYRCAQIPNIDYYSDE